MLTKKIYQHQLGHTAQSFYRQSLPGEYAPAYCTSHNLIIKTDMNFKPEDLDCFETFVFPRLVNPTFRPMLQEIKKRGKRIVWELDDDVWHIPKSSPAYEVYNPEALALLEETLDMADSIIVSTEPLKAVVNRPDKTHVLPNLVDCLRWPRPAVKEDDKVIVLWTGSAYHEDDVELLAGVVDKLIKSTPDNVVFYFWGAIPECMTDWARVPHAHTAFMVPHSRYQSRVGFIHPVSLERYALVGTDMAPDIVLCPLANNRFSLSKSANKYYEGSLMGAATIASNLPPYDCIEHGVDGLLVNSEAEWVWNIQFLLDNPDTRKDMAAKALAKVEANFTWQYSELLRNKWVQFYLSC